MNNPSKSEYNLIIIGGGIAGLYKAYQFLKKNPKIEKVLLLEATSRLGGRILTYRDDTYKHGIEAGAGRFHKGHRRLIKLIHELGLENCIMKTKTTKRYIPSPTTTTIQTNQITMQAAENLIDQVIQASKKTPLKTLQTQTFLQYADQVLPSSNPKPSQQILDSFGYSTELTDMNAYDTIQLMENHYNKPNFYGLKGGMEQIVTGLVQRLQKHPNFHYHLREPVIDIIPPNTQNPQTTIQIKTYKTTYTTKTCICAILKEDLVQIPLFKQAAKVLKLHGIENRPLCRIYTKFAPNPNTGEVWFHDLIKTTTNSPIRYIIPIDPITGTIMVSYTDNNYADYWNHIYTTKGARVLNRELQHELQTIFPDKKIPIPTHTKVFYWKHGVAYYQPGFDSTKDLKRLRQPFPDLPIFLYGENYSEKNPQWIEGALES